MSEIALRMKAVTKRFYLSDNLRRESAWTTTYRLLTGESEHRPIWAVKEVSLELRRGEILGVIGPNGAGKSTLLLLAAQILEPTEGVVEVFGRTNSFFQLAAGLSPKLSVLESFELSAALLGMAPAQYRKLLPQIIAFSGLEEFLYAKYGELSSGMAARVAFSTAVHADLDIILIDEGMSVGDEAFQKKCREKVNSLMGEGKTCIIVSHGLDKLSSMSKRILYLNRGYPLFLGEPSDAVERMRRDFGHTVEIDESRKQALRFVKQMPEKLLTLRHEMRVDMEEAVHRSVSAMQNSVVEGLEALMRHHMDAIKSKLELIEKAPHYEATVMMQELQSQLSALKSELQDIGPSLRRETLSLSSRMDAINAELKDLGQRLSNLDNTVNHLGRDS